MFTGIIQTTGIIKSKTKNQIQIEAPEVIDELKIGSSIAVDGVCLTVVEKKDNSFTADVMPITFEKTILGKRKKGDLVNLELAMKHTDRFEGHVVSGHVENTAKLSEQKIVENAYWLTFDFTSDLMKYVVPQGSIAINGISLTVSEVQGDSFAVSIIPHTWDVTNLHKLKIGDKVNIETDLMAKYAEKLSLKL
ncbi:riboflavin synthase [Candidatus Peregrinibacteria bacterium]|nr:riboflavin synthase [Candidatus Peregrinibacteria bacterium]